MDGSTRRRRDARRNHETVIEAALELLAADPDASMQDIAEASGLGRTTVYRHFPTRDELFAALLEDAIDHSWDRARTVLSRADGFEPTLRELSLEMIKTSVRYRFLLTYRNPAVLHASRTSAENPVRGFFRGAQESGEIRDGLPLHWIMSCFQALVLVAMQDHAAGHQDLDTTATLVAETIVAALAPPA